MPIHWDEGASETCICIRGHFEEYFYDSDERVTDTIDIVTGGCGVATLFLFGGVGEGNWEGEKGVKLGRVMVYNYDWFNIERKNTIIY